jgi:hypothetical protein
VGAASAVCEWILLHDAIASCSVRELGRSAGKVLPRRMRSMCATALGVMVRPRRPRLASSRTAQISEALVSPGQRPMIFVRRRTSTKVRSSRFVLRVRLRCSRGKRRCATSWSTLVYLYLDAIYLKLRTLAGDYRTAYPSAMKTIDDHAEATPAARFPSVWDGTPEALIDAALAHMGHPRHRPSLNDAVTQANPGWYPVASARRGGASCHATGHATPSRPQTQAARSARQLRRR